MSDFIAAFGLMLVFEGLLYGGFPKAAKAMVSEVLNLPEHVLRLVGISSMIFGLGVVWLVRG